MLGCQERGDGKGEVGGLTEAWDCILIGSSDESIGIARLLIVQVVATKPNQKISKSFTLGIYQRNSCPSVCFRDPVLAGRVSGRSHTEGPVRGAGVEPGLDGHAS